MKILVDRLPYNNAYCPFYNNCFGDRDHSLTNRENCPKYKAYKRIDKTCRFLKEVGRNDSR